MALRRIRLTIAALALAFVASTGTASAAVIAYMTGAGEPWGSSSNIAAMNTAFGLGNWDHHQGFNAAVLSAGYEFIFIDGGDGNDAAFMAFMNANVAAVEGFVAGGGAALINAARWTGGAQNIGFGVTLNNDLYEPGASGTGQAVNPLHPIFLGPNGASGTNFTGTFFSHDYLTGTFNSLMIGDIGQTILADKTFGLGYVMLGGLTTPNFHGPQPQADILRANMLDYAAAQANVPEPASLFLLATGVAGMVVRRRKS